MIDLPTLPDEYCGSIRHAMGNLPDGTRAIFLNRVGEILRRRRYVLTERDVFDAVELSLRGLIQF